VAVAFKHRECLDREPGKVQIKLHCSLRALLTIHFRVIEIIELLKERARTVAIREARQILNSVCFGDSDVHRSLNSVRHTSFSLSLNDILVLTSRRLSAIFHDDRKVRSIVN
jgi:hypothetical protein